jgi:hypothetical protein
MRIPLLRPGFRPEGPYKVSFVYLHAGPAFAKKGDMQMALPRMDVPVSVVEWELFVPDQYRADRFNGTAIAAHLIGGDTVPVDGSIVLESTPSQPLVAGQIAGLVVDPSGAVIPGATVTAQAGGRRMTAVTDNDGRYVISNIPAGPLVVTSSLDGFKTGQRSLSYDERPRQVDFQLAVGAVTEMVTVSAEAPLVQTHSSTIAQTYSSTLLDNARRNAAERDQRAQQQAAPSVNVQSLQRRAAGVLPVRIDVPRAGSSHRFVKPLVVDEETVVGFRYRRR